MPAAALYTIGEPLTVAETTAVIDNIVPALIRQRMRFQDQRMLILLQQHFGTWVEHEVNRARGLAFTSNIDEGFSHGAA